MDFKEIIGLTNKNKSFVNSGKNSHKDYIPLLHSESGDSVSFKGAKKKSQKDNVSGISSVIKSLFSKFKGQVSNNAEIKENDTSDNIEKVEKEKSFSETKNSNYTPEQKKEILQKITENRRDWRFRPETEYLFRIANLPDEKFEAAVSLLQKGASFKFADYAVLKFPDKIETAGKFLEDGVNEDFIKSVALNFDEKQTEQAKELTGIFKEKFDESGDRQFDLNYNTNLLNHIFKVSRLDETHFSRAKLLTERENFDYSYFYDFSCLDEVKFERAQNLFDKNIGEFYALYTSRLSDENYKSAEELNRKGIPFEDISVAAIYGDEKFSRAINRGYFEQYPVNYIRAFIQVDDNVWGALNKGNFIEDYIALHSDDLNSNNSSYIGENMQNAGEIGFALKKYSECNDFTDLTSGDKRLILSLITSVNSDLFDETGVSLKCAGSGAFVPKNKDEYCSLVSSLAKNVGIKVDSPSDEAKQKFINGLNALDDINSPLRDINFDSSVVKVSLEYSKDNFCSDVMSVISDMPDKDKKTLCNLFGFQIQKDGNNLQLQGYPVNIENDAEIDFVKNPLIKEKAEELRPYVVRFSKENKIKVNSSIELENMLNDITAVLPEIFTKIGKKQDSDYTSDLQTLKMLQSVIRSKDYSALTDNDKKLLKIAVLLSGINSKEDTEDKNSPENSAYDAYYILSKTDLSERDKTVVYDLIKNIDGVEKYSRIEHSNLDFLEKNKITENTAFNVRRGNEFNMLKLLSSAYLKSVQKDNVYYKNLKPAYLEYFDKVSKKLKEIKSTSIYLPQSKIPAASDINCDGIIAQRVKSTTKDGKEIENTVINLKPGVDLSQCGFEEGLVSDDLCVLLHGLDEEYQTVVFNTVDLPDSKAVLSTSFVRYGENEYHVFRPNGLIVENDCDDIHAAFCKDFGSGTKKDFDTVHREYLFCNNLFRNYISDRIKEKLNIDDEEYSALYEEISQKSLTELEKTKPEVASVMRKVIKETAGQSRSYGRKYNEVLVSAPKIKGVFCYGENGYSDLPDFLKGFASKNNLPVINFGN